jgi:hypothetical protein
MFNKFLLAVVAVALSFSSASAEEVKGVFVKFADGKVTVKVDDKDKEFKVPAELKIMVKKELLPASEALGKIKAKAKQAVTLTVEKDEVKDIKLAKKEKAK